MSTYRVPKCGRHFMKFDDVTIYPVLVVARTERVRVSYPKFKNGEATVRSVQINPNFGKWFPSMCCKLCEHVCI